MNNLTQLAHDLYEHKDNPGSYTARPRWDQLGEVTKGVWLEYARRKLAGDPHWYSVLDTATAARFFAATSTRIGRTMSELNVKKLAEQFDELAQTLMAISGTFRNAGGAGKTASDDGKVAGKPAARKGKAAAVEAEDDGLTIDAVREKLKELVEAKGKDKMVEALESVGAAKLADVDESQYQELVDAAQGMIDEEDEAPAKKPAAKKTAGKAKKGPTLDEVNEAAKALIAADKPAYLKLTKKLGKPSEMEESDYAAAIEAYTEAMPAEEGEDDLL